MEGLLPTFPSVSKVVPLSLKGVLNMPSDKKANSKSPSYFSTKTFEHPKHMFKLMDRKILIITILCSTCCVYQDLCLNK